MSPKTETEITQDVRNQLKGPKQYSGGTLASILEDRLADLLLYGTVSTVEEFVSLVEGDVKQDLGSLYGTDLSANLIEIGIEQAIRSLMPDAFAKMSDYEKQTEGLGIAIAHSRQWDGLAIMRIFRAALEDANFHTEASMVQAWIDKENRESRK